MHIFAFWQKTLILCRCLLSASDPVKVVSDFESNVILFNGYTVSQVLSQNYIVQINYTLQSGEENTIYRYALCISYNSFIVCSYVTFLQLRAPQVLQGAAINSASRRHPVVTILVDIATLSHITAVELKHTSNITITHLS